MKKISVSVAVEDIETAYDVLQSFNFIFKITGGEETVEKVFRLKLPNRIKINKEHKGVWDVLHLIANSFLEKARYFGAEVEYAPYTNAICSDFFDECAGHNYWTLKEHNCLAKVRQDFSEHRVVEPLENYAELRKEDLSIVAMTNSCESVLTESILKKFGYSYFPCHVQTKNKTVGAIKENKEVAMVETNLLDFFNCPELFPEDCLPIAEELKWDKNIPHYSALLAVVAACSRAKNVIVGEEYNFSVPQTTRFKVSYLGNFERSCAYRMKLSQVLKTCAIDVQIVSILERMRKTAVIWQLYDQFPEKTLSVLSCEVPNGNAACLGCRSCERTWWISYSLDIPPSIFGLGDPQFGFLDFKAADVFESNKCDEEMNILRVLNNYLEGSYNFEEITKLKKMHASVLFNIPSEILFFQENSLVKLQDFFDLWANKRLTSVRFNSLKTEDSSYGTEITFTYVVKEKMRPSRVIKQKLNWGGKVRHTEKTTEILHLIASILMVPFHMNTDEIIYPALTADSLNFLNLVRYFENSIYEYAQLFEGSRTLDKAVSIPEPQWGDHVVTDYAFNSEQPLFLSNKGELFLQYATEQILKETGFKSMSVITERFYTNDNKLRQFYLKSVECAQSNNIEVLVEMLFEGLKVHEEGGKTLIYSESAKGNANVYLRNFKNYYQNWISSNILRQAFTVLFQKNGYDLVFLSILEGVTYADTKRLAHWVHDDGDDEKPVKMEKQTRFCKLPDNISLYIQEKLGKKD